MKSEHKIAKDLASIRSDLDDMEFEFVQGTVLHTEGDFISVNRIPGSK